jgi:hypothetical protein
LLQRKYVYRKALNLQLTPILVSKLKGEKTAGHSFLFPDLFKINLPQHGDSKLRKKTMNVDL